jgi:hypothetical protein
VGARAQLKYHYFYRFFTYSVKRRAGREPLLSGAKRRGPLTRRPARSALKTVSGGEFDWGGTSVKR